MLGDTTEGPSSELDDCSASLRTPEYDTSLDRDGYRIATSTRYVSRMGKDIDIIGYEPSLVNTNRT